MTLEIDAHPRPAMWGSVAVVLDTWPRMLARLLLTVAGSATNTEVATAVLGLPPTDLELRMDQARGLLGPVTLVLPIDSWPWMRVRTPAGTAGAGPMQGSHTPGVWVDRSQWSEFAPLTVRGCAVVEIDTWALMPERMLEIASSSAPTRADAAAALGFTDRNQMEYALEDARDAACESMRDVLGEMMDPPPWVT